MKRVYAAAATLVAVLVAAFFLAKPASSGKGQMAWHYNPYTREVWWNTHEFPKGFWVYFIITYENGYPPFESGLTLSDPGYVEPWASDKTGCGWQDWVVYGGSMKPLNATTYHPTLNPSESSILAQGHIYVCNSGPS